MICLIDRSHRSLRGFRASKISKAAGKATETAYRASEADERTSEAADRTSDLAGKPCGEGGGTGGSKTERTARFTI